MEKITVHLHGGPLDGTSNTMPPGPDGQPREQVEFEYEREGGRWFAEYRRERRADDGWHYQATGNEQRSDEE